MAALPAERDCTGSIARATDQSRLAVEAGGRRTILPLDRVLLVGSGPHADVRVRDSYVSARHCRLTAQDRRFWIEDLGSKNGTFVDGVRVRLAELVAGREIRVGNARLRVVDAAVRRIAAAEVDGLVGASAAMCRVKGRIERIAPHRLPVLIRGETGTGKELAALAIHRRSSRRSGPFVAVNCAAIPHELAESELFGHVRGSFTGADRDHRGAFARARAGTIFLDEVAELPAAVQAKLLRVLETARVTPVGSEKEVECDARVLAATHRDIDGMILEGGFREDLFHRLGVLEIDLPPLRERRDDIPPLLEHFLAVAARELGVVATLAPSAMSAAVDHDWPGNVRALRNAVMRAVVLANGPIEADELLGSSRRPVVARSVSIPKAGFSVMRRSLLEASVAEHGSRRRAALALGIPRSTFCEWLKR